MAQMDPSHSVPQELMSHVHLVSAFRYPTVARLDVNEVVRWLMNAPQVARDRAPFFWTYLDKPTDGTVLLTWQPLQRLNSNFATDGFIWAPPEQVYKQELGNGLILEIYYLKAGYMPGEQFALHARRRFRLMPMPGHPNPPQIDISLFIVHYGPSDHNDRIPAAMVPYDERVNAIMQQRHYLLRGGQIRRKEFMLSDRVNWPMLPELTRQQMAPQMGPQMMGRGVPQQMAYPPQPVAPPPAKRARHSAGQGAPPVVGPALQPTEGLDDDEDITRGDMFDQVTQREVSLGRFKQSYEWMEEILSSAYRMNQIMPSDLNLGLKGELSALTEGIFTAQGVEVFTQAPDKPYVGKLDEGLADEFRKRVDEYIKTTQAEMDDIKAQHATTMASLRTGSVFTVKEAELRALSVEPAAAEPAKGEESSEPAGGEQESEGQARHRPMFKKAVDDVSRDVEAAIGRKIVRHPNVRRIQQGGYQAPEPQLAAHMSRQASHNSGVMMGDADVDMGGTAAGLLDQMHSGMSSTSTPVNNASTPQPAGTPSHAMSAPSPKPDAPDEQSKASDDWVVVPRDDAPPVQVPQPPPPAVTGPAPAPAAPQAPPPDAGPEPEPQARSGHDAVPNDPPEPAALPAAAPLRPTSAAVTPAATDGGSAAFDQNDFSSLGDLDTAGDALAGYDAPDLDGAPGDLGQGLDLQMDIDDSAFGDAFHGVNASDTPGPDQQNQDV